jgi:exonuclease SbcD
MGDNQFYNIPFLWDNVNIMSLTLMHLADIHLGAPLAWMGDKASERRGDVESAFVRAVDYGLEHVDLVLLAGDIFDSHHPPENLITLFRDQMQRFQHAIIPVAAVPGNHDGYSYPDSVWRRDFPGMTLLADPCIETPVSIEVKGQPVHIYGMAYQPTHSKDPFDEFKRTDALGIHIALIHGSITGNPEWGIRKREIPLDTEKLGTSGMDYIALGHYHRFNQIIKNGVPIVYPGSLEGLSITDVGDRFLVTAHIEPGHVDVHKQVFQSRTIRDLLVDITSWEESGTEQVIAHLQGLTTQSKDIYLITLTGTATDAINISQVEKDLEGSCFMIQLKDDTSLLGARTIERIAKEPTVRGAFVRAVLERVARDSSLDRQIADMALRYGLKQFLKEGGSNENS